MADLARSARGWRRHGRRGFTPIESPFDNGFTLIELLVVIAIIAILAAILFPIFQRAKERSKTAGCAANEHQIFIALMAYCDNWSGRLPDSDPINFYPQRTNLNQLPDPRQIHSVLLPYVGKSRELFHCPADKLVPRMTSAGVFDTSDPRYSMCDYAIFGSSYQWRLGHAPNRLNGNELYPISGKQPGFYPFPSRLSIMRDAVPFHESNKSPTIGNWNDKGQGGNVLYLDGHVKFIWGTAFLGGF